MHTNSKKHKLSTVKAVLLQCDLPVLINTLLQAALSQQWAQFIRNLEAGWER